MAHLLADSQKCISRSFQNLENFGFIYRGRAILAEVRTISSGGMEQFYVVLQNVAGSHRMRLPEM
jgi:hypothetical protein